MQSSIWQDACSAYQCRCRAILRLYHFLPTIVLPSRNDPTRLQGHYSLRDCTLLGVTRQAYERKVSAYRSFGFRSSVIGIFSRRLLTTHGRQQYFIMYTNKWQSQDRQQGVTDPFGDHAARSGSSDSSSSRTNRDWSSPVAVSIVHS